MFIVKEIAAVERIEEIYFTLDKFLFRCRVSLLTLRKFNAPITKPAGREARLVPVAG